jgi:hypothetical protein
MKKALISVMAILAISGCIGEKNRILLRNDSDENFHSVTVSVCDSTWTIQNFAPGEKQEFTVVYTRDDHFTISAEAADGHVLEGGFGYVTHGISDETIEITFIGDSIRFNQSFSSSY